MVDRVLIDRILNGDETVALSVTTFKQLCYWTSDKLNEYVSKREGDVSTQQDELAVLSGFSAIEKYNDERLGKSGVIACMLVTGRMKGMHDRFMFAITQPKARQLRILRGDEIPSDEEIAKK